jgi:F-box-like
MEQLPTNILVKIFEYLSVHDLISVSGSCKKFQEVATNFMAAKYPPVRIDFQFLYYSKIQKFTYKDGNFDFNVLIETTRHFQNFIFLNFNKEHTDRLGNKWLQLFKRQINARSIRIKSDCLDLQQLSNMLKLTSRLVFLEIDGYRLAKTNEPIDDSDIATLPSLKHLKIHSFLDTTPQLFKIFQECKTLKTISLSALFMVNKKMKSINELICNQRALEQLDLIGLDTHNGLFQSEHVHEIRYKLKKLNVEYNSYSMNLEKFVEFLTHQKSLKEVSITSLCSKIFLFTTI